MHALLHGLLHVTVTIKGPTVACLGCEFVFSKVKIIVRGKVP